MLTQHGCLIFLCQFCRHRALKRRESKKESKGQRKEEGWSEAWPYVQDMNTRLLSANLDFDSRLQHVSCCAADECPDS